MNKKENVVFLPEYKKITITMNFCLEDIKKLHSKETDTIAIKVGANVHIIDVDLLMTKLITETFLEMRVTEPIDHKTLFDSLVFYIAFSDLLNFGIKISVVDYPYPNICKNIDIKDFLNLYVNEVLKVFYGNNCNLRLSCFLKAITPTEIQCSYFLQSELMILQLGYYNPF